MDKQLILNRRLGLVHRRICLTSAATGSIQFQADHLHDGVAISLDHGSILIECAKTEWHATSAISNPDERDPSRVSLVYYQHRDLNQEGHGFEALRAAEAERQARRYEDIVAGKFRPTLNQLKKVGEAGFELPGQVDVIVDGQIGQVLRQEAAE